MTTLHFGGRDFLPGVTKSSKFLIFTFSASSFWRQFCSNGTSFWILLRDSKTKNKSRGFFTMCKITERLFGSTDSAVLRVGALRSSSRDTLNLRCGAPCSGLPMTILLSSASPLHSTPNPLILGWENNANEFCNLWTYVCCDDRDELEFDNILRNSHARARGFLFWSDILESIWLQSPISSLICV